MGPCVRRDDVEIVARRMTDFVGQTVEAARRALAARLKTAAIDSAALDARLLIGHALGLDLTGLIAAAQRQLTPDESTRLEEFARRRLAGEPVARIIGEKEFWGLPLRLSTATLVPRPDTETVVELALELLRAGGDLARPMRIADLGTGTGAILLALLSELPAAEGFGTDISEAALQTAAANAACAGLSERATFIACDYARGLSGSFDLIVSNPPYIRSADIERLSVEVRNHDPLAALDGGADGLDAYRALIPQAAGLLAPGAALVVEAGEGQSGPIQALMTSAGLMPATAPKADLAGIPRAVAGHKMAR
ncbi:release factor glutamine methyltransferase [Bradyrhizobium sp. AZCC 1578]